MRPRRLVPYIRLILTLLLCINLVPLTRTASANTSSVNEDHLLNESCKLSPQLEALAANSDSNTDETVSVIVQTTAQGEQAGKTITSKGGRIKRSLPLINGYVAEVPRSSLKTLASEEDTLYVSLDRRTTLLQAPRYDNNLLRVKTGAENVIGRNGIASNDKETSDYVKSLQAGPNGKGVTIAV